MHSTLPRKLLIGILIFLLACSPTPPHAHPPALLGFGDFGGPAPGRNINAPGTPRSLDFGYGARIEMDGLSADSSLRLAAQMNIDWVALDFDWNAIQPAPDAWNEDSSFSNALQLARSLGLATLVSVKNPPAWALTPNGPDADAAASLVVSLAQRYPNLGALELFPGANTRAGWNAAPDAGGYVRLFETAEARLAAENLDVYLVAGGLSNLLSSPEDARDVDFLGQLYAAGLRPAILGIRLDNLVGQPLDASLPNSLRHYEDIRAVMTANGHVDGLLWITGFGPPAGVEDETWLKQAFQMMQSQLYLGTVFYHPRSQFSIFDFRLSTD